MRHRVAYRKLGRVTEHRIAMLRNQTLDLFRHERIQTTVARAKELRPFAERIISVAKRSLSAAEGSSHFVTARRTVARDIPDRTVVEKLFTEIAPRYAERAGGYTRLLRLGYRRGDSAEVAEVELLGSEYDPNAEARKTEAKAEQKPKGVGGRLRAAAERLRGKAKPEGEEAEGAEAAPKKKAKPERTYDGKGGKTDTRGKGAKTSSPRKAGGS